MQEVMRKKEKEERRWREGEGDRRGEADRQEGAMKERERLG